MSEDLRGWTPELDDVRDYFALVYEEHNAVPEGTGEAGFDRWLAQHDAEVRADEREKAAQDAATAVDALVRSEECHKDCDCVSCEAADDVVFAVLNGWAAFIARQSAAFAKFVAARGEDNGHE